MISSIDENCFVSRKNLSFFLDLLSAGATLFLSVDAIGNLYDASELSREFALKSIQQYNGKIMKENDSSIVKEEATIVKNKT